MDVVKYLFVSLITSSWSFILEGTTTSFAQFNKWNVAQNGSLEFEFKTQQGNGLLMYTDDGGMYDFFEIKLVESALRLRYNLGGGAQILTIGHDLSDNQWHKVRVTRNHENTLLTVDNVSASSTSRGKEFDFGQFSQNSDVYIGGMPVWYNSKLTLLALPSVIFEPRFNGLIRNLIYSDDVDFIPRRQKMKSHESRIARAVVSFNTTDICETHNPCLHNGICISTDDGPVCECRVGEYNGNYCEKDKLAVEASFKGTEYIKFEMDLNHPAISLEESINLQFKTRQHNGLLFYSGSNEDYLIIAVKDGGIAVSMTLANGRLDLHIKPTKIRFDDNQWHKIMIQRLVQEISTITRFCRLSAIVDDVYAEHAHTAGSFTQLRSDYLYIAGGTDIKSFQGVKSINNFVGCLRKVFFKTTKGNIDVIEAAKNKSADVITFGKIEYQCREPKSDPVTFTTQDSHLVLPPWKAPESGSMSFKIRTTEPNGLVMYCKSGSPTRPDLFAFEILDGHLYLHINLGSGFLKLRVTKDRMDNGTWHEVSFRRVDRNGRVTVNGDTHDFETPGDSKKLDVDSLLYIGSIGVPFPPVGVPPVLWTGALRQGFVGCMRDFVMDGQPMDIAGYAQQQDSGAIRPACHSQTLHCSSQPCMHGGICSEGWNRFYCDCSSTAFTGPTCGKDASTLYLNGSQYMTALMPDDSKTQAEDISLRFKTTRPKGLLLSTTTENKSDQLEIYLDKGTAKLRINIDANEKILLSGRGLNDDMWHNLKYSRRGSIVKFQVDDEPLVRVEASLGKDAILRFRTLHVAGSLHSTKIPSFVGYLEQLWFNGNQFFEIARTAGMHQVFHQGMTPIIRVTGKFGKRNHPIHHSVTFTSKHTYIGLPLLKAYVETNIYFQFKTKAANGLILYNSGKEHDFIAIELIDGHIHYSFDLGDGPIRLKDTAKSRLNDGKWHAVSIGRPGPKKHTLAVDDHVTAIVSHGTNENLDLDGILYIGGVDKMQYTQLPKQILSHHGFEGCLASLDLSGESIDLIGDAIVTSTLVEIGCDSMIDSHSVRKCSHEICRNNGVCVQHRNNFECDCDMTGFSGPICNDEATAYEFGPGKGLITYLFPHEQRPERRKDTIAMGFITNVNDAVLLRMESATSEDFLEIEIVNGNLFAVYNMGTNDHPIGEISVKVNDDQYHVVRFVRNGANSTLQVDDYSVQSNHPIGHQLSVFNTQSTIQIGGKWNKIKGKVERPFLGVIAGLVVNGVKILDLNTARHDKILITIRGDVQPLPPGSILDKTSPLQRMQQTPASGLPGVMDDLIYSGAGSGCAGDDEDDDCTPIYDPHSDDLITPVYTASTKIIPTVKPNFAINNKEKLVCDDEEDCEEGSGDASTTEKISTPTQDLGSITYTTQPEFSTNHVNTNSIADLTAINKSTATTLSQFNVSSPDSETTSTIVTQSTNSATIFSTSPKMTDPPIYHQETYPPIPTPPKTKEVPKVPSIHSDAAKNAALIIAIIAGALIAIVLIILLILKFKNRPETNYKIDDTKNFCQDPNAALLGTTCTDQQYNCAVKTNNNANKNGKKRELKDIKEWYV